MAKKAAKKVGTKKSAGRKRASRKTASRGGPKKSAATVKTVVETTTVRMRKKPPIVTGPATLSGALGQGPVVEVPVPRRTLDETEETRTVVTRRRRT